MIRKLQGKQISFSQEITSAGKEGQHLRALVEKELRQIDFTKCIHISMFIVFLNLCMYLYVIYDCINLYINYNCM
jgi:hypothetical protein